MSHASIKKSALKKLLLEQGYSIKEITHWLNQWDNYDLAYRQIQLKAESIQARKNERDDYENIFSQKEMEKIIHHYQKLKDKYPEMEIETNFSLTGDVSYFVFRLETKEELISRLINTMKIQNEFKALSD
jgi:hypothetical protein